MKCFLLKFLHGECGQEHLKRMWERDVSNTLQCNYEIWGKR